MRWQVNPASWFAELCEVAGNGRKAAHDAKADNPKRYEPPRRLQDSEADRPNLRSGRAAGAIRHYLHSRSRARMLVRCVERETPTRRAEPT